MMRLERFSLDMAQNLTPLEEQPTRDGWQETLIGDLIQLVFKIIYNCYKFIFHIIITLQFI